MWHYTNTMLSHITNSKYYSFILPVSVFTYVQNFYRFRPLSKRQAYHNIIWRIIPDNDNFILNFDNLLITNFKS